MGRISQAIALPDRAMVLVPSGDRINLAPVASVVRLGRAVRVGLLVVAEDVRDGISLSAYDW
ncbi:MAG: hypothetical protein VKJ46_06445 [Leptolyngbyaceae bacterium]|nr:hypothetical protein [Leptolyngbyaceae bacterium]